MVPFFPTTRFLFCYCYGALSLPFFSLRNTHQYPVIHMYICRHSAPMLTYTTYSVNFRYALPMYRCIQFFFSFLCILLERTVIIDAYM